MIFGDFSKLLLFYNFSANTAVLDLPSILSPKVNNSSFTHKKYIVIIVYVKYVLVRMMYGLKAE